ncbi:hypothetical protein, partial [Klebsiella pneumoniae]|uniref:hypothetical protein n=1 Tax=Klebsiella pneumoniae TaxID=573 RepID=UPI001C6FB913
VSGLIEQCFLPPDGAVAGRPGWYVARKRRLRRYPGNAPDSGFGAASSRAALRLPGLRGHGCLTLRR